jgi:hypothetical protein
MGRQRIMLVLGSLVLVPMLFAVYVAVSYRIALSSGRLPITNEPEWIWWLVLVGVLIVGAYLVWLGVARLKAVAVAAYVIVMTAVLLGVHHWVACMNGDCL